MNHTNRNRFPITVNDISYRQPRYCGSYYLTEISKCEKEPQAQKQNDGKRVVIAVIFDRVEQKCINHAGSDKDEDVPVVGNRSYDNVIYLIAILFRVQIGYCRLPEVEDAVVHHIGSIVEQLSIDVSVVTTKHVGKTDEECEEAQT